MEEEVVKTVVGFFGHREVAPQIELKIRKVLIDLIEKGNARKFYVGNEGAFDHAVQRTLFLLSKRYSDIRCYIVLAYLPARDSSDSLSLETVYPEGLELVPRRFAICKRNEWILSRADVVVAHAPFSIGNSYQLKLKAERKGKKVINIL